MAASGLLAAGMIVASLSAMHRATDRETRRREQEVVASGLLARMKELEAVVTPTTVWDDAVRNLDNGFDRNWAHHNVGVFLNATSGFDLIYVLDSNDLPIYGFESEHDVPRENFNRVSSAISNLIAKVRGGERERAAVPQSGDMTRNLKAPIQGSGMRLIDDRLYFIAASLVQPDFGTAEIKHSRAPIVVTARVVDDAFLKEFSKRYLLQDLHFHDYDAVGEPGEAHVAVRDENNQVLATLDWTPQTPGTQLFAGLLPTMLATFSLGLGGVLLLFIRARDAKTKVAETERHALHMACHDKLTGLYNRAHLEAVLKQVVEDLAGRDVSFAIYAIDIDHFSGLNDVYGHEAGNELLKKFGQRLNALCGPADVCVRYGGDAFAILKIIADPQRVTATADRIMDAAEAPFALSIGVRKIEVSVGVAVSAATTCDATEYLRQADLALNHAKQSGRNRYCIFDEQTDCELRQRDLLIESLRSDIAECNLTMVYQPQVDRANNITGVEALARWTHPVLGAIPPDVFVPLAERSGLIRDLGRLTTAQALKHAAAWTNIKLALNFSAIEIRTPDFGAQLIAMVRKSGISPSRIEVEITEGVLLDDDATTLQNLGELRDAGFRVALDDFGTGYSSLSYLSKMPIDKIKLDRSFVVDLGSEPRNEALVAAVVNLARALGVSILAEGVETIEQRLRLMSLGCGDIQGYLASRPISAEQITALLTVSEPASVAAEPQIRSAH
jgi:diguanylate cyclase (GGDEF)-like protein